MVGEYAVVNLSSSNGKPKPTLSGLGITSSSTFKGWPAPNCICKFVWVVNLVTNLLFVDTVCNT